MHIRDEWLPAHWKGTAPSARTLKHFGVTLTVGACHVEWRDRCGDLHWLVTYRPPDTDLSVPLDEFRRLTDAITFALDPQAVAAAVAFEQGAAT